MKTLHIFAFGIVLSVLGAFAGCGGGGSYTPPSYGGAASSNSFLIKTQTQSSGATGEIWGNVKVSGYANQDNLSGACTVTSDPNCIPVIVGPHNPPNLITQNGIASFSTDTTAGEANFFTTAETAGWTFFADGTSSSENDANCSTRFATNRTLQGQSSGMPVPLQCGADAGTLIATPSSCGIFWRLDPDTQAYYSVNTCPSSVAITVPSSLQAVITLPTTKSIVEANVNSVGTNLAQSTVTASTSTTVNVPVPNAAGITYIVLIDPSTTQLIGIAPFTYIVQTKPTNPCTNPKINCGE